MDGSVLVQITSCSITWNSGNQRVDLLNEGLGGFTPGSGDCQIELGFAVPIGGLEEDYVDKLVEGDYVTMQIPVGRKDYAGKGKIDSVQISQSVNASVEGTLTWNGELKKLQ